MSPSSAQIYEMHPGNRSVYWLTCALALVCGIVALAVSTRVTDGRTLVATLGALFTIGGFCMFIRPETVVDSRAAVVRREFRLFGRLRLWSHRFRFSDFAAVVIRHGRRSGWADDPDNYFVSLRCCSGRVLLIRYFQADSARACRPAEELAHRLSADLGIEIDDGIGEQDRPENQSQPIRAETNRTSTAAGSDR